MHVNDSIDPQELKLAKLKIDQLISKLKEFDALRDADTVSQDEVDRIQPAYANEWPALLNPSVREAMVNSGIVRPYQHQANAIVKALSGADVVMESPTASGKTLAFTAPMLHVLKENPGSHAMMIYPMKALAFDQRAQIRRVCEPLGIEAWHYDGDTDGSDLNNSNTTWLDAQQGSIKAQLRKQPPHILLTNPEYLNMSFLGSRRVLGKARNGSSFPAKTTVRCHRRDARVSGLFLAATWPSF